jgi:hypothetical protein
MRMRACVGAICSYSHVPKSWNCLWSVALWRRKSWMPSRLNAR